MNRKTDEKIDEGLGGVLRGEGECWEGKCGNGYKMGLMVGAKRHGTSFCKFVSGLKFRWAGFGCGR
jgi:hypothetical protein